LEEFGVKLKRKHTEIEFIVMDMSRALQKNIPDSEVVFYHFYVIKLMNDKLDKVRLRTAFNQRRPGAIAPGNQPPKGTITFMQQNAEETFYFQKNTKIIACFF
jgi:transposase